MKIALIHAMTESVKPIEHAFLRVAPEIELLHFMDTGLLKMVQKGGEITPAIIRRFSKLLDTAAESDADIIQLTCSAFNDLAKVLQPLHTAKIFRSDEAMLDEALVYKNISLISTVEATPIALQNYLFEKDKNIQVKSFVNTQALQLMKQGKQSEHDQLIQGMIREAESGAEVIVLSQYSMAHVAQQVNCSIPILTGPELTAKRCQNYLLTIKNT